MVLTEPEPPLSAERMGKSLVGEELLRGLLVSGTGRGVLAPLEPGPCRLAGAVCCGESSSAQTPVSGPRGAAGSGAAGGCLPPGRELCRSRVCLNTYCPVFTSGIHPEPDVSALEVWADGPLGSAGSALPRLSSPGVACILCESPWNRRKYHLPGPRPQAPDGARSQRRGRVLAGVVGSQGQEPESRTRRGRRGRSS